MDPTYGMWLVSAVLGVAAWTLTLWWLRETWPVVVALPPQPMDCEPHTVTVLGANGRPNPLHYERLPTYAAALARQRDLARHGHASIIAHADSGQVRLDLAAWLGPCGRIGL